MRGTQPRSASEVGHHLLALTPFRTAHEMAERAASGRG